jgi:lipoic acid synthetase
MRTLPIKQKGEAKTARIPIRIEPWTPIRKPTWIRAKAAVGDAGRIVESTRKLLREQAIATVCEEASCPNLGECFGRGTATFMILGDICTRRCPFCDVGHGRPAPPDPDEPARVAEAVARLALRYAVITSVDRDDLRDGGAGHFTAVMAAIRERGPDTAIEILVPDFRGRQDIALAALAAPDVFNHNLETVPRLYPAARPGADYRHSLSLLAAFKTRHPDVPTKSGLMVGLGETDMEIHDVMRDLRANGVDRLTIGQYLAPSPHHLPVRRYVPPETFLDYEKAAMAMGFAAAACAPLVRSSYWAENQGRGDTPKAEK